MDVYFQLLNPLVFLIFAVGFVAIHKTRPSQPVFLVATAYLFAVSAFLFDIVHDSLPVFWGDIWVVMIYATGTAILACGIQLHYSGKLKTGILIGCLFIHIAIYSYFMYIENFWLGSFSANFGTAIIFSAGIYGIHKHLKTSLDKVLFVICIISIIQNIARPSAIALMAGEPLTQENYSKEMFLITLHLSIAVCAVSMAMTLLMIFSRDIFNDMRQTSVTDALTNILNRRGFESGAEKFFDNEEQQPLCLILADIDHFKALNDDYGHGFGDKIIIEFARLFEKHAGKDGVAARIGGEEFVMLVPGKSLHDSTRLAVEIRHEVKDMKFPHEGKTVSVTASFGVSQRQKNDQLSDMLKRADDALYESKMSGRDKVTSEMSVTAEALSRDFAKSRRQRSSPILKSSGAKA
ncbi:MAG: GGDEF domain-containing protein [Pseudomonadota bacterium]